MDYEPADQHHRFQRTPFIAIWEVTQACDLACVHCRASAQPDRNPMELRTDEGKHLIDEIAALEGPRLSY
jgi:MoaA/NifB/PqqE/SkfB family radical SAM enzyme